jgi:hypothetical protein
MRKNAWTRRNFEGGYAMVRRSPNRKYTWVLTYLAGKLVDRKVYIGEPDWT